MPSVLKADILATLAQDTYPLKVEQGLVAVSVLLECGPIGHPGPPKAALTNHLDLLRDARQGHTGVRSLGAIRLSGASMALADRPRYPLIYTFTLQFRLMPKLIGDASSAVLGATA